MNNALQPIKENIFKKILNWFKNIFNKDTIMHEENVANENKIENKQKKNDFLESIRLVEDDAELLKLQEQFENGEIYFNNMSMEEINDLYSLYKRQIKILKAQIEGKKMELNLIKLRKKANM